MEALRFNTFNEADANRERCDVCGGLKKAIEGDYSLEGNSYLLVDCTQKNCTIHCICK